MPPRITPASYHPHLDVYTAPAEVFAVYDTNGHGELFQVPFDSVNGDPVSFRLRHAPAGQVCAQVGAPQSQVQRENKMTQEITTLQNYLPLALRTEKPLPTVIERLDHAALGLITETGEIATEIKRMAIYGKSLDDVNKDGKTIRAHIAEEIGDTLWYMAIADNAANSGFFSGMLSGMPPRLGRGLERGPRALKSAVKVSSKVVGTFAGLVDDWEQADSPPLSIDIEYSTRALLGFLGQELVDMADMIGVPLERIAADNIAKLRERFPDAYSNEAAEARADKGGLDARNS